MVAGAVLWITEVTPIGLTAIIVVVLLALCPGIGLSAAGSGLASEVVFFLIGAVAIGAAVEASGPSQRAARLFRRLGPREPGASLCADDRKPAGLCRARAVGDHAQRHPHSGLSGRARAHGRAPARPQRAHADAGAWRAQSAGVLGAAHRRACIDDRVLTA